MQNLSNDEEFELFVSQKFETSLSMTIFSSRNFFFFSRTISHFSEFRKADDLTQKIKQLNSETEKTKANKLSIDELTKTQTEEQEVKTTFFSITETSSSVEENDIDD
jgi:predicted N-acyltransferase